MTVEVELRCPVGPRRLFLKIVQSGERPKMVDSNLLEVACADCRKALRLRGRDVRLVLHRFDILGELVESEIVD